MGEQGGFGVVCKLKTGEPAAMASIAHLLDVDFPKLRAYIVENTGHDSPGGWYTAIGTGKKRAEPFSMKLGWDVAQPTHAQIVISWSAQTPVDFSIQDPAGTEVLGFSILIEEITRMSKQEEQFLAEILVHPSGPVTITAA